MLYIYMKSLPEGAKPIYYIDHYFRSYYTNDWLNDPFCEEMVMDIDKTEHFKDGVYISPIFGYIVPERLSTGVRLLMTLWSNPETEIYYGRRMGDNCFKWANIIGKKKDIYLYQQYCPDKLPEDMEAIFMDTGKHVKTGREFADEYYDILDEMEDWPI